MINDRIALGKQGEETAKNFLEQKGYQVLARNYRCPLGEMDLICKDNDELVFVEVKTRRTLDFGDGAEAVQARKMKKLVHTALFFLKANKLEKAPFRFDVVSILSGQPDRITHIQHAFP